MIAGTVSGLCSAVYARAYSFLIIEHLLLFVSTALRLLYAMPPFFITEVYSPYLYFVLWQMFLTVDINSGGFEHGTKTEVQSLQRSVENSKSAHMNFEKIGLQPEEAASSLFLCTVPHKAHPMHLEVCC